jgi:cytochrome c-type biogenesis protein CcmH
MTVGCLLIFFLCAFTVDHTLPDAAQEARAQKLFHAIKCVVCQGQPLNESNATLAQDMRKLIRQQIAAGKTDVEITAYLAQRYGKEIATTPPLEQNTWLLWFSPFLLLAGGGLLWYRATGRARVHKRK